MCLFFELLRLLFCLLLKLLLLKLLLLKLLLLLCLKGLLFLQSRRLKVSRILRCHGLCNRVCVCNGGLS